MFGGRSDSGHYWDQEAVPIDGSQPRTPYLVEKPESTSLIRVNIKNEPMLFEKLANTQQTEEGILEFANSYGLLTRDEIELFTPVYSYDELEEKPWKHKIVEEQKGVGVVIGESKSLWVTEIEYIRWATRLWGWVTEANEEALGKVIYWSDSETIEYIQPLFIDDESLGRSHTADKTVSLGKRGKAKFAFTQNTLTSKKKHPEIIEQFQIHQGDLLLPAQLLMQRVINYKINQLRITPALLMNKEAEVFPFFVTLRLIDALWLQLFTVASGERKYKRCLECGRWQDVSEKRKDWKRHFDCSNAKRQRDIRKRREEEQVENNARTNR